MSATTTLTEITRQIADGSKLAPNIVDTFSRMIDATGPLNSHLRFLPEGRAYERAQPIDMNSKVHGDFLSVMYDSHWPSLLLSEHGSRDEIADFILDWVLLDCEVFAFENGRRLLYRIEYDDTSGPRRHFHPNIPTPAVVWIGT